MRPDQLMKPDLLSEIVLLSLGAFVLSSMVLFVAAVLARM